MDPAYDKLREDQAKNKDDLAQKEHDSKIRELHDNAPDRITEDIFHRKTQHSKNLKNVDDQVQIFKDELARTKQKEQDEYEAKQAALLRSAEIRLAEHSRKFDVVTQAALNNLEGKNCDLDKETLQMEKEILEARANSAKIQTDVDRQIFNEVEAQKDRDQRRFDEHAENLKEQVAGIQDEEENVLAKERAQKKEHATSAIAEIRNDLVDQQKLGFFNLSIQQRTDDRKNRRQINQKIMEVKGFAEELDQCFGKAYGVLAVDTELYLKVKKSKKEATRNTLTRFNEILSSISTKLGNIEQNLASLELNDINDMTKIIRQIKTQISSFGKVIANLNLILELETVPIETEKTEEFSDLKTSLFEMINCMEVIPEKRDAIINAIQERQTKTMPNMETLQIEN